MRLNQHFDRRPTAGEGSRVSFKTPEPVKADVSEPVKIAIPPLSTVIKAEKEIPALMKIEKGAKKVIELTPPGAQAAPAVPKLEKLEPTKQERTVSKAAWPFPLKGDAEKPAEEKVVWPSEEVTWVEDEIGIKEKAVPEIPKLEINVRKQEPQDIPALTVYNKMEVVHLLLGRSPEDDEIILIRSIGERELRNIQDVPKYLRELVTQHADHLRISAQYDAHERALQRSIRQVDLSSAQKARGVEYAFINLDNGEPTHTDVNDFVVRSYVQEVNVNTVQQDMRAQGYYFDPYVAYSWALVQLKVNHGFSYHKLSDIFPNL